MRNRRTTVPPLAAAAILVALAGGCAAPKPAAIPEGATVRPVERAGWNAQPEPGLYRITWDAQRTREIRSRAELTYPTQDYNPYFAERLQLDAEGERELKARGLCAEGAVVLHSVLDAGESSGVLSAVFKCRPTVF
jgi:hypothetical protein